MQPDKFHLAQSLFSDQNGNVTLRAENPKPGRTVFTDYGTDDDEAQVELQVSRMESEGAGAAQARPAYLPAHNAVSLVWEQKVPVLRIELPREPGAASLKRALETLAQVAQTLCGKEAGYGSIEQKVCVFAPNTTALDRVCTRIDEKLTRISQIGVESCQHGDAEDTLIDLIGYLALLCGLRDRTRAPQI